MKRRSIILMTVGIALCIGAIYYASNYKTIFNKDLFEGDKDREEEESGVAGQMYHFLWAKGWPDAKYLDDKWMQAWQQAQALRNPEVLDGRPGYSGSTGSQNKLQYGAWT